MADTWEYKTHFVKVFMGHMDTHEVDEILNADAAKGWELIHVTPVVENNTTQGFFHHYRRIKESDRRIGFSQ